MYLQFPFVQYALIVGVLIALCSSLLGVTLVLKRFSFIGDGLSHVAFGAMAIAGILNLTDEMLFVMPVTVICAILLLRDGGRLHHPVRLHLHPDPDPGGSGAVHRIVRGGGGDLPAVLQQDFRRHL